VPGYFDVPQGFTRPGVVSLAGARTVLAVPMLKENELVGAIVIYRQEVRPFTDKQIALVTNFAAQAVIAIENARLLNELRESLEQQTATSEVLRVISSSPGDLEPVFEAMLENAVRICGAKFGNLWVREGERFRIVASHGGPPAYVEFLRHEQLFAAEPGSAFAQLMETKDALQINDIAAIPTHGNAKPPSTLPARAALSLFRC
jgi:hypothetical protein